jgi:hypothetical protein
MQVNRVGGILGSGFDLKITRLVSWRVFEADWLPSSHHFPQVPLSTRGRTLSTTGQESVRQFPFNAADSLTLIGGREKPAAAKAPAKKKAPMKKK